MTTEWLQWAIGNHLGQLFTIILCHCQVRRPMLCHKFTETRTGLGGIRDKLENKLKVNPEIELPLSSEIIELGNRLLNEEINYNKVEQKEDHSRIFGSLNSEQHLNKEEQKYSMTKPDCLCCRRRQIFELPHFGTVTTRPSRSLGTTTPPRTSHVQLSCVHRNILAFFLIFTH
uniref:Uncharacterized protein n=1 Tax=Aegilops tauschii subsp. strangulata TaxID=200361 RepID=A0A453NWX8_AEGTS